MVRIAFLLPISCENRRRESWKEIQPTTNVPSG